MGAIKITTYSIDDLRKSNLARALAVPARLIILKTLSENEFVTGEKLKEVLGLAQATIHHHLTILQTTGLIEGEYMGKIYGWKLTESNMADLKLIHAFLINQ